MPLDKYMKKHHDRYTDEDAFIATLDRLVADEPQPAFGGKEYKSKAKVDEEFLAK